MTKDERLLKAEECLQKAAAAAMEEPKARVYLGAADLWIRLAAAGD